MSDPFFKELQGEFLQESTFLLEQYEESMLQLENGNRADDVLAQIFRVAHSIKGGASAVGFSDLAEFAHIAEDLLSFLRVYPETISPNVVSLLLQAGDALRQRVQSLKDSPDSPWDVHELAEQIKITLDDLQGKKSSGDETSASSKAAADMVTAQQFEGGDSEVVKPVPTDVTADPEQRVVSIDKGQKKSSAETATSNQSKSNAKEQVIKLDVNRVDAVLDAVGEIVVLKNQLLHDETIQQTNSSRLAGIVDQLDKLVRDLYDRALAMRMTPLRPMFIKIQRIVRDVSLQLGKKVQLVVEGEETEVERTVFELLGDPMTHLIRNALDHGIEVPEKRKEVGKSEWATLRVSARQLGGNVVIDITDDGRGIDRIKVFNKAKERGLVTSDVQPEQLTDEQVFSFLFMSGFSTAEKVTDLSGRGVGLDVVKSNIEKIRGNIEVFSKLGQGTTFRLKIPLSTAITDGIILKISDQVYILPIYSIGEIVRAKAGDLVDVAGRGWMLKVRDRLIPVTERSRLLGEFQNLSELRDRAHSLFVIIEGHNHQVALSVDQVLGQAQVVAKPAQLGFETPEVSGSAILGDGRTVFILDPQYILSSVGHGEMGSSRAVA
jgi:two-component system chemotaxis sensor kinase CheA